jgi:hypothetical protein
MGGASVLFGKTLYFTERWCESTTFLFVKYIGKKDKPGGMPPGFMAL